MHDNTDDVLELLQELVSIPSVYPPGDTSQLCAAIARRMESWGYAVEQLSRREGAVNVLARLGEGRPEVVFNCHIDTVAVDDPAAWESDPYRIDIRNGRVYGLGVNNCKGPAAAQLWAAREIAKAGPPARGSVVFTFAADEEALGPDGTFFLREAGHVHPDMLIVGAQTENALIVRERGVTWIELEVRGRTAHAGAPEYGDNAIMRTVRLLAHMEKTLMPRIAERHLETMQSTLNVGVIRGGSNINVVPASCTVAIDRRVLPLSENIDGALAELHAVLAEAGEPEGSFSLRRLTGTNGFHAPKDGPLVSAFNTVISKRTGKPVRFVDSVGAFDGRFFADDGVEIVNFGPGEGTEGHKSNESTPLDQLLENAVICRDLIFTLLYA